MSTPLSLYSVASELQPREAVFTKFLAPDNVIRSVWLARETGERLDLWRALPNSEFRIGYRVVDITWDGELVPVGLIPLMTRTAQPPFLLYESWINEYGPDGGVMETLTTQTFTAQVVYGERYDDVVSITLANDLKNFAQRVLGKLASLPQWTPEQYELAKQTLRNRYRTSEEFWRALGEEWTQI